MATQSKKEQRMLRQAFPVAPAAPEEAAPPPTQPTEPAPAHEPPAQCKGTRGDYIVYIVWLICFALMALHVLADTFLGWLFSR